MRFALLALGALVVLAAVLGACSGILDGTVSGELTISGGPAPGCSRWPLADSPVRAHLATKGGPLAAIARTGGDGGFLIRLKPGVYVLTSNEGMGCSATAVVVPRGVVTAMLDCGAP